MLYRIGNPAVFAIALIFVSGINLAFADIKTDIYSKLKCCPCPKEFITCSCPQAGKMKAYIEALLEMGLNEEEILVKVAEEYSLDVIIDEEMRDKIEKKLIERAGDKRPEIFIQPLSYNLGKVSKNKGELELKVKVQNKGNEVLKITDLKTSCACTTVRLKTENFETPAFGVKEVKSEREANLAPQEEGELIIVTDLNHPHVHLGQMLRIIDIKSNDPVYSLVKVEIEAEIVE